MGELDKLEGETLDELENLLFPGVRECLISTINLGYQNLIQDSDSLRIVLALKDQSLNLSPVGPIVEDSKALLDQITRANLLISLLCISLRPFGLSTTWDLEIEPDIRQVTFASRKGVGIKSCGAHLLLRNRHS
ncbi:hypothetical protein ACFX13_027327 [Malus domestica]